MHGNVRDRAKYVEGPMYVRRSKSSRNFMTHQVTGIPASADETRMYVHRTYANPIILVRHLSSSTPTGGQLKKKPTLLPPPHVVLPPRLGVDLFLRVRKI